LQKVSQWKSEYTTSITNAISAGDGTSLTQQEKDALRGQLRVTGLDIPDFESKMQDNYSGYSTYTRTSGWETETFECAGSYTATFNEISST